MTWRERIVAARERGYFTTEDKDLILDNTACLVAEACEAIGKTERWYVLQLLPGERPSTIPGWTVGVSHCSDAIVSVRNDRFDWAEETLDAIEDRVLQLKREQIV